ncbi:hypothetical protein KFK09_011407 [Dendrobium nobile]|uniref:Dirigent protein n=1 Tax=Dendrobium nobile TaxID=94219 RepID=A0A8T3BI61_DENNO|nr:hypothetical protein KFK09_011407 [Dendrobium nobile]
MKILLIILLLPLLSHTSTTADTQTSNNCASLPIEEKHIKIHFFWHNKFGEPNPTAVTVAQNPIANASSTGFGLVNVFDDPITIGPKESSHLLGRSQGTYILSDQNKIASLMAMTFVFAQGEFRGCTLAVLGRNEWSLNVRELPIVGGTGLLRSARGYCLLRNYNEDNASHYVVLEYNCDVFYKPHFQSTTDYLFTY